MIHFKVFTGPMFGGKTTRLLTVIERDVIRGMNVLSFKPKIDTRYSQEKITTHLGASVDATLVTSGVDIIKSVRACTERVDSVAIDEFFMIPMAGSIAAKLFQEGINIYISSLQLSSIPDAYEEVAMVLPWATEIVVCPAVCVSCGADAYYTLKTGGDPNAAVEVGGADLYQPRCFEHFFNDT
jgi:thymidine kinase